MVSPSALLLAGAGAAVAIVGGVPIAGAAAIGAACWAARVAAAALFHRGPREEVIDPFAVGEPWRTWHGGRIDRLIRLDISIYDGFSGGPLVDDAGRVLGMNTSALLRCAPSAVPAATVDRVLDLLVEHGRVPTGYLGVAMQAVRLPPPETARAGLMIVSVEPDGPAGRAGILLGDVITAIDGATVSDPADVLAQLDTASVGKTARLELVRAGKPVSLPVQIGERPAGERSGRGERR